MLKMAVAGLVATTGPRIVPPVASVAEDVAAGRLAGGSLIGPHIVAQAQVEQCYELRQFYRIVGRRPDVRRRGSKTLVPTR